MDMPVNVPVDHPDADTEWNDILRKHGVIPEKPPSPTPMIEEALTQARELAHEHRLESKDLDELDELEDEEDEDFLNSYRQKRMNELTEIRNASVYGQVYPVQKPEYSKEVTDESQKTWVLVLLTSSSGMNTESRVLTECWRELATKWGDLKFCQMAANLCIEGYPDKNTPTVLIYREGNIRKQIVTLAELAGPKTGIRDLEKVLLGLGALQHGDPRLKRKDEEEEVDEADKPKRSIRDASKTKGASVEDGSDSDWD
ncbi:thioredoxin-like protein [Hortaea werneckii]|uniref:Phosducin domain-containing protein n=1 Tax=Hortaea werneckii TaxID=91943 RepID=A0A3M7EYH8_HORWE|nr:thioredoxin-like protein [Hortaea werneckii]KAI6883410.1 thioredoxin-like protein [Hortaea werneckii]KAI6994969.1 thioredoxin-like protein [Hortaea werneckii]KAI7082184.1 thioredoxin-like protein [Hortaea werneckii]KAI7143041.1 thioredoxin-like protein [Hortaea werneckii]